MEQALHIAGVLPAELVAFLRLFEDYERLRETAYHFFSNNRDWIHYAIGYTEADYLNFVNASPVTFSGLDR